MSERALKNLTKTRTYRERSQPKARQKLGILEKHKDYKERAVDYHKKEDALKKMREKAAFKNQDEFYFGMTHTQLKDGRHMKKARKRATEGELANFTREDISYLSMKQVSESKKVARLRANLHSLDELPKNTHTLFVDGDEQAARFKSPKDFARHLQTPVELLGRATHRPRAGDDGEASSSSAAGPGAAATASTAATAAAATASAPKPLRTKKQEKAKAQQYRELEQRENREAKFKSQLEKLRLDKVLQAKGVKRKVTEDGQPRQYKFKQVRSR